MLTLVQKLIVLSSNTQDYRVPVCGMELSLDVRRLQFDEVFAQQVAGAEQAVLDRKSVV